MSHKHIDIFCAAQLFRSDGVISHTDFTLLLLYDNEWLYFSTNTLVLNYSFRPKHNPDIKSGFKPKLRLTFGTNLVFDAADDVDYLHYFL